MPVVVDTSMTIAWVLPDEQSAAADAVLDRIASTGTPMLAPALWELETANVLVSARRRGRLTDAQVGRCSELLSALPITIDDTVSPRAALVAAALRADLSAYDAAYLLLAERTGSALASLDRRLIAAAEAAGIEVWSA